MKKIFCLKSCSTPYGVFNKGVVRIPGDVSLEGARELLKNINFTEEAEYSGGQDNAHRGFSDNKFEALAPGGKSKGGRIKRSKGSGSGKKDSHIKQPEKQDKEPIKGTGKFRTGD